MTNQKKLQASDNGSFEIADVTAATASKNKRKVFQTRAEQEYWRAVRLLVIKRDDYQCQNCGEIENLCVHHLTYEHQGQELDYLEDLQTLCASCHTKLHKTKWKFDPNGTWEITNCSGGHGGKLDGCIETLFEVSSRVSGLATYKQIYNRCLNTGYVSINGWVIYYVTGKNESTLDF